MALENYMLPCFSKTLFGVECFGCGLQRSAVLVFQGKLGEAWQLFPAIYPMFIFAIFLGISIVDKSRNYGNLIIGSAVVMAIAMVVSYFFRHPVF